MGGFLASRLSSPPPPPAQFPLVAYSGMLGCLSRFFHASLLSNAMRDALMWSVDMYCRAAGEQLRQLRGEPGAAPAAHAACG